MNQLQSYFTTHVNRNRTCPEWYTPNFGVNNGKLLRMHHTEILNDLFTHCVISSVNDVVLGKCLFEDTGFSGFFANAVFENCVFNNCVFTKIDMSKVKFINCKFNKCFFQTIKDEEVIIDGCTFEKNFKAKPAHHIYEDVWYKKHETSVKFKGTPKIFF